MPLFSLRLGGKRKLSPRRPSFRNNKSSGVCCCLKTYASNLAAKDLFDGKNLLYPVYRKKREESKQKLVRLLLKVFASNHEDCSTTKLMFSYFRRHFFFLLSFFVYCAICCGVFITSLNSNPLLRRYFCIEKFSLNLAPYSNLMTDKTNFPFFKET